MPEHSFTIMFDGKFQEGRPPEEVKAHLAKLFKASPEQIEQLCAKAPVVVKKGLDQQQALQYEQIFIRAGAFCRITQEPRKIAGPHSNRQKPSGRSKIPSTSPKKKIHACPKCGQEQEAGRPDCLRCGIVFSRFQPKVNDRDFDERTATSGTPNNSQRRTGRANSADIVEEDDEEYIGPLSIEREGWLSLAGGAVITVIVLFMPFLTYILSYMSILVHELGHSVSHWLFGYPSIPAFDFMYGGGVAIYQSRETFLLVLIYLCFGYVFYLFRRNTLTIVIFAVIVAAYSLAAFTPAHEVIGLFMGHGFELLFATIFLYRAISGSAVIIAVERPLYAFLGLFIEFKAVRFAYRLMTSQSYRAEYEAAKGGGHWMDFSRIAEEYLRVDLTAVASFFLLCCIIPPFAAFLAYRYRSSWMLALSRILNPEPE